MNKLDLSQILREIEDKLVPRLQFTLIERAAYYHLLRHTRLEGKRRVRVTLHGVGRGAGVSPGSARHAMRSLADKGVLRILTLNRRGHVVELRLPCEIAECRRTALLPKEPDWEKVDFFRQRRMREAIHRRERGECFYCHRRVTQRTRMLDHVVPFSQGGKRWVDAEKNSYRNLVSCCANCNFEKADQPAPEFLRKLYRDGRLNRKELAARIAALKKLAKGGLKPRLTEQPRLP